MLAACTQQLSHENGLKEQFGDVRISIVGDEFLPVSKSQIQAEFVPDINDLKIEVFKNPGENQIRLYRDSYANTIQKEAINLNCADYRILASYGDSLAVGFDAEKIY